MNILITGGTGYIGSHTAVSLLNKDDNIIIIDNLSNSKISTVERINKLSNKKVVFYKIDVTKMNELEKVFSKHEIDSVIHFAGLKAVGESVIKPIEYYYNNLVSTMNLSKMCLKYQINKFVFSSSATVYGDNISPLTETMKLLDTTNPYGETKAMSERILIDVARANPKFEVTLLRYFNPVGAHESGLLGENPEGIPNNLMPYISKVAKGELKELNIFGNDYNTNDGTGVRDYIHVVDLAKGHVNALKHSKPGINIYNLGTGHGTSVLEIVNAFVQVNKVKIPYKFIDRRPGDLEICYADVSKANKELNWKADKTIEDMVRDSWNFEKHNL